MFKYSVLMKGITWSRDSHGLFDYESRHLTKRTMKTSEQVQIVRNQNELELINMAALPTPLTTPPADTRPLLNIINENGKSYLHVYSEAEFNGPSSFWSDAI